MSGIYLNSQKCQILESHFRSLVNTIGLLLPMLEVLDKTLAVQEKDRIRLAKQTSLKGHVAIRNLLWDWAGYRNLAAEEAELASAESLSRELQAQIQKVERRAEPA